MKPPSHLRAESKLLRGLGISSAIALMLFLLLSAAREPPFQFHRKPAQHYRQKHRYRRLHGFPRPVGVLYESSAASGQAIDFVSGYASCIEEAMRDALKRIPGARTAWALFRLRNGRNARFEADYGENSGAGSTLEITSHLISTLPSLLREYQVKTLLDVPCGDFLWMKEVDLTGIHYTGGDIIKKIAEIQSAHGSPTKQFRRIDLIADELPGADMILVRDCLVHLPYAIAIQAVQNIQRSRITYLLATTFPYQVSNTDILAGQHRLLNLCASPFGFPKPLKLLNEGGRETPDKSLGLWRVADLPKL